MASAKQIKSYIVSQASREVTEDHVFCHASQLGASKELVEECINTLLDAGVIRSSLMQVEDYGKERRFIPVLVKC